MFGFVKKLRLTILMALALALLCGCGETPAPPVLEEGDPWSVYLYLCGSNLETKMGAAGKNIDEILAADLPDGANIVIETGGAGKWRSHDIPSDKLCRYTVKDGKLSEEQRLDGASMGDAQTLSDFIGYCLENYPAKRTALILWDHGGGASGEVCFDENYGMDCLTPAELKKALGSQKAHFDVIGFDACLMATNETAALMHEYADYMLASEEISPSGGWDYGALVRNLSEEKTVEETCRAVVDGYIQKCGSSNGGELATLSLFDLGKYDGFLSAFNGFAQSLGEAAERKFGNFGIVRASEQACKFGATGRDEGASNLIDLYDFASQLSEENPQAAALMQAIDRFVPYRASVGRKGLGGVSLYFPLYYDQTHLSAYFDLCSSQAYKDYLSGIYANPNAFSVEFSNWGSVGADGCFEISLTAESKRYLKSVEFSIVSYSYTEQYTVEMVQLGIDNDLKSDWENLIFQSNFRGVWLALDGAYLNYSVVESTEEYILFSAPVIANGVRSNLRFMFVWDDGYFNGGYYKIIGLWNGLDEYNLAEKQITPLKEGDEITVLRKQLDPDSDIPFERVELSEGETVVIGSDGGEVKELPLKESYYQYVFIVSDIFGNQFYSNTALMTMKYSYEELLEHPLPDGAYAADIRDIYWDSSWGLVG